MDVGPDEDRTADQAGSSKQLQIGLLNSHEQPQMRTSSYRLQTAPTCSFIAAVDGFTTAYTAQGTAHRFPTATSGF